MLAKNEKSPYIRVKLLNRVENSVVKGEIASFEQFHLWPQCFQNASAGGKGIIPIVLYHSC